MIYRLSLTVVKYFNCFYNTPSYQIVHPTDYLHYQIVNPTDYLHYQIVNPTGYLHYQIVDPTDYLHYQIVDPTDYLHYWTEATRAQLCRGMGKTHIFYKVSSHIYSIAPPPFSSGNIILLSIKPYNYILVFKLWECIYNFNGDHWTHRSLSRMTL